MPQNTLVTTQTGGVKTALGVSASTVIKAAPGRIARVSVTTAGAAGAIYDSLTVAGVGASNLIATIPATVGVYAIDFSVTNGIVYVPGVSQVASFSYY